MKKKHIITIAGKPGSGKSTASKEIASILGYEHFSSGDLFRAIAHEQGLDVFQNNLAAEKNQEIDFQIDQRLRDIGENQDQVAIDSRMAWHWMPYSFKVYLDLDLEVAAKRILKQLGPERIKHEHIPNDPEKYAERLRERLASETKRYNKLYDANPYDTSNYDLVIDTAMYDAQQVIDRILEKYKEWLAE